MNYLLFKVLTGIHVRVCNVITSFIHRIKYSVFEKEFVPGFLLTFTHVHVWVHGVTVIWLCEHVCTHVIRLITVHVLYQSCEVTNLEKNMEDQDWCKGNRSQFFGSSMSRLSIKKRIFLRLFLQLWRIAGMERNELQQNSEWLTAVRCQWQLWSTNTKPETRRWKPAQSDQTDWLSRDAESIHRAAQIAKTNKITIRRFPNAFPVHTRTCTQAPTKTSTDMDTQIHYRSPGLTK